MERLDAATRDLPRAVVETARFIHDSGTALRDCAAAAGFDWPVDPATAADRLQAFVDPDMVHRDPCPRPPCPLWPMRSGPCCANRTARTGGRG